MTGYGRGGKPKSGFPPRPQPLEIAKSAIPTFPPPRRRSPWKSGNPKAGFPLSHRLGLLSSINTKKPKKGGLAAGGVSPPSPPILPFGNFSEGPPGHPHAISLSI